ncbi:MAG: TonB-dependent receptor domain-containing protein, partial [Pseudomonas sp.]
MRFVGSYEKRGGMVDHLFTGRERTDDQETSGGRVMARFAPTDHLNVLGSVFYQKREFSDSPTFVRSCAAATNQCFGITGQISDDNHRATNLPVPLPSTDEMWLYNLTVDLDLGFGTLTSASSYFDRDTQQVFDISDVTLNLASFLPFLPYAPDTLGGGSRPETNTIFSQEVRFASAFEGPVQVIGGLFYSERQQENQENTDYIDPAGVGPNVIHFQTALDAKFTNKAVFGELTYSVTDKLAITGGLRAFELAVDASDTVFVDDPGFYTLRRCPNDNFTLPPPGTRGFPRCNQPLLPLPIMSDASVGQRKFSDVTFKANVAYSVTDDILFYTTVADGFREGGVNGSRTSNFVPLAYAPDQAINYELGWKTRLFDQLTFNGALFRLDWKDTQVQVFPPFGVFGAIYNAGRQRI